MDQNMLGCVIEILTADEKGKRKPGGKVFNEAGLKLHQREKIYMELDRSASLSRKSIFRVFVYTRNESGILYGRVYFPVISCIFLVFMYHDSNSKLYYSNFSMALHPWFVYFE